MIDSYEIKEYIDKQEHIVTNLVNLIFTLTYKQRVSDDKLCRATRDIIATLKLTSFKNGPGGETWPDWKKKPVKHAIKYLCKVLDIDIDLFNIERR